MLSTHSGPPHTSRLMHYHPMQPYVDLYNKATSPVLSHTEGYAQATSLLHPCRGVATIDKCPDAHIKIALAAMRTNNRFW